MLRQIAAHPSRRQRTSAWVLCGLWWCGVGRGEPAPARAEEVHDLALAMPHVTVTYGTGDNPIYQVGGKSFIFFVLRGRMRSTPRPGSAMRT